MHLLLRLKGHNKGKSKNFEKIYLKKQVHLSISAAISNNKTLRLIKRVEDCIRFFLKTRNIQC